MDSPPVPRTLSQEKAVFVNSPLTPRQQKKCVKVWERIVDVILKAETQAERQNILDETARFLVRTAEAQGLVFDIEAATEAQDTDNNDDDNDDYDDNDDDDDDDEVSFSDVPQNPTDEPAPSQEASGQDPPEDRVENVEKALDMISIDIAGSLNRDKLLEMRTEFVNGLTARSVRMMRNNKERRVRLTATEISHITNFFFSEVWGAKGVNRVRKICQEYLIRGEESFDGGLQQRADTVAQDESIPIVCRNLVQGLSKTVQSNYPDSSDMRGFRNNDNFYHFRLYYDELLHQAKKPSPALRHEWQRRHVETGKGHSVANQVQQYLVNVLQMSDASQLGNTITQSTLIHQLVGMYGPGILLLLPRGAPRLLQRTGVAKVTRGVELWMQVSKDHHDEILDVCSFLETHIYKPLVNGEALQVDTIRGGSKVPFMTRLEQAKMSKGASGHRDASAAIDVEMDTEMHAEVRDEIEVGE